MFVMKKSDVEGNISKKSRNSSDGIFFRHGETPLNVQIDLFIKTCNDFIRDNPADIIGMIYFERLKINFYLRCSLYTWI